MLFPILTVCCQQESLHGKGSITHKNKSDLIKRSDYCRNMPGILVIIWSKANCFL